MSDDVIIRVDNLWKRYGLPLPEAYYQGRQWLQNLRSGQHSPVDDGPWALRDMTFEVKHGETLGIIGRNGAGKSTLLKVLAHVSPPTRGKVKVFGRVFPMIELNAGLHTELTGRENVYLLGAIMGLSRRQMNTKLREIEEFTELGEWFDRPVRKYSSGMLARLGFSVALNVEADVLLVDEVLSVGDLTFQVKCYDYLENLKKSGSSILLVSHSLKQIERICTRAILLDQGCILAQGDKSEVVSEYYRMGYNKISERQSKLGYVPVQDNTGEVIIKAITLIDKDGKEVDQVALWQSITIRIHLEVVKSVPVPNFAINILTIDMIDVAEVIGEFPAAENGVLNPGSTFVDCTLERFSLLPGTYSIGALIVSRDGGYRLAQIQRAVNFTAMTEQGHYGAIGGGFIKLDAQWRLGSLVKE